MMSRMEDQDPLGLLKKPTQSPGSIKSPSGGGPDDELRNPSFYQPGRGNILSFFSHGDLTPSPTDGRDTAAAHQRSSQNSNLTRDVEDPPDLQGGGGAVGNGISNLANYLFSPSPGPKPSRRRSSVIGLGGGGKAQQNLFTAAATPEKRPELLLSPLPASPLLPPPPTPTPPSAHVPPASSSLSPAVLQKTSADRPAAKVAHSPSSPSFIFEAAKTEEVEKKKQASPPKQASSNLKSIKSTITNMAARNRADQLRDFQQKQQLSRKSNSGSSTAGYSCTTAPSGDGGGRRRASFSASSAAEENKAATATTRRRSLGQPLQGLNSLAAATASSVSRKVEQVANRKKHEETREKENAKVIVKTKGKRATPLSSSSPSNPPNSSSNSGNDRGDPPKKRLCPENRKPLRQLIASNRRSSSIQCRMIMNPTAEGHEGEEDDSRDGHPFKENQASRTNFGVNALKEKKTPTSLFSMHFSPPKKNSLGHTVNIVPVPEGPPRANIKGGGMFNLHFSPPPRPGIKWSNRGKPQQEQQQQQSENDNDAGFDEEKKGEDEQETARVLEAAPLEDGDDNLDSAPPTPSEQGPEKDLPIAAASTTTEGDKGEESTLMPAISEEEGRGVVTVISTSSTASIHPATGEDESAAATVAPLSSSPLPLALSTTESTEENSAEEEAKEDHVVVVVDNQEERIAAAEDTASNPAAVPVTTELEAAKEEEESSAFSPARTAKEGEPEHQSSSPPLLPSPASSSPIAMTPAKPEEGEEEDDEEEVPFRTTANDVSLTPCAPPHAPHSAATLAVTAATAASLASMSTSTTAASTVMFAATETHHLFNDDGSTSNSNNSESASSFQTPRSHLRPTFTSSSAAEGGGGGGASSSSYGQPYSHPHQQQQQQPEDPEVLKMRTQLMQTLEDLINTENDKKEVVDKLIEIDHKANKLAVALEEEMVENKELRQCLQATKDLATEKDHMITELRHQLEHARLASLEATALATAAASERAQQKQKEDQQKEKREEEKKTAAAATAVAVAAALAQQAQAQAQQRSSSSRSMMELPSPVFQETTSFLTTMQERMLDMEKMMRDRQSRLDADRERLEGEIEHERNERRALEDALNTLLLAGGFRGLGPRELASTNKDREAALEARAGQLRGLLEQSKALQAQATSKAEAAQAVEQRAAALEGMVAQRVEEKEQELDKLRYARHEADRQVEALSETVYVKEEEIKALIDQLRSLEQCKNAAEFDLKRANEEAAMAQDQAEKLKEQQARTECQLSLTETQLVKLKEEQMGWKEDFDRVVEERMQVEATIETLQVEKEQAEAALQQFEAEKERMEKEAVAAELDVAELQKQRGALQTAKETMEKRALVAEADVGQLQEQLDGLQTAKEMMEKRALAAEAYVGQLQEQLDGVQTDLHMERLEHRKQEEEVVDKWSSRLREKEEEIEGVNKRLSVAKDLAAKLEEELQVKTTSLMTDLDTVRQDLQERRDMERQVEEQRRRMAEIMSEQRRTMDGHLAEVARERDMREALEVHVMESRQAIQILEEEKEEILGSIDEYKAQAQQFQHINMELQRQMARMEEDCERSDMVRKALHNQVVELKGNIRVFVRVRPLLRGELPTFHKTAVSAGPVGHDSSSNCNSIFKFVDSGVGMTGPLGENRYCRALEVTEAQPTNRGGLSEKRRSWRFSYDQVFGPKAGQEALFNEVLPLIQSALDGYKVCIFAYGQTGSGKTYTMMGPDADPTGPDRGVVYRATEHIFAAISALKKHGWTFRLSVAMVEIYNEKLRDLLAHDQQANVSASDCFSSSSSFEGSGGSAGSFGFFGGKRGLEIRHHAMKDSGMENPVPGLTSTEVHQASEVTGLVSRAMALRCTKSTRINTESSRSHCIFTLKIEATSSRGVQRHGCLHLIDLAGSERLSKSGSNENPELLREAQSINKSLSVLANVMSALHKKDRHVPFRESALTNLLRHSLGGDCKALMICNLSPSPSNVHESMCSLRFAQKVNAVVTSSPHPGLHQN